MTLSTTALAAIYAQETGETLVPLLTLEHASWTMPVRLAGWHETITSRGLVYTAYPFDIELPEVSRERVEPGRVVAANVTRELVPALRSVDGPITATVELVRASAPDTVEVVLPQLEITELTLDAAVITAPLVLTTVATQRYPADKFGPATFPGLVP